MFGDWNWLGGRTAEQEDRCEAWLNEVTYEDLVVIEMGAGTAIPTVRNQGNRWERAGATLIRINPRESQVLIERYRFRVVPKRLCWQLMR